MEFTMTRTTAIAILVVAATLEAAEDALVRVGLHANVLWHRAALFGLATAILFAYGWTVNAPPWDFGKLLGLYVVLFFVIAQIISWGFFKQTPSPSVICWRRVHCRRRHHHFASKSMIFACEHLWSRMDALDPRQSCRLELDHDRDVQAILVSEKIRCEAGVVHGVV